MSPLSSNKKLLQGTESEFCGHSLLRFAHLGKINVIIKVIINRRNFNDIIIIDYTHVYVYKISSKL